jgi:hypothetical protein
MRPNDQERKERKGWKSRIDCLCATHVGSDVMGNDVIIIRCIPKRIQVVELVELGSAAVGLISLVG